ncbi:MAG: hypothetical protein KGL39_43940 [Patescibacteria group bacterium]|nr:hypothetical protein [Patescibacteria group bacterium]
MPRKSFVLSQKRNELFCVISPFAPINGIEPGVRYDRVVFFDNTVLPETVSPPVMLAEASVEVPETDKFPFRAMLPVRTSSITAEIFP